MCSHILPVCLVSDLSGSNGGVIDITTCAISKSRLQRDERRRGGPDS